HKNQFSEKRILLPHGKRSGPLTHAHPPSVSSALLLLQPCRQTNALPAARVSQTADRVSPCRSSRPRDANPATAPSPPRRCANPGFQSARPPAGSKVFHPEL